jgi:hypothetical protein
MSTKIEPKTTKNKILVVDTNKFADNEEDDEEYTMDDEIYYEEKRIEYSEMTLLTLQKSLLEYVDRKNLTLCEYLTPTKISEFLGYS